MMLNYVVMKKVLLFVFVTSCVLSIAKAQDVIVLKNTDEIQAKILEISPNTVTYVEWDFQDGPTRIINKRDIFVVKYQNGKKEVFSDASMSKDASNRGKYIDRIKVQSYLYFGTPLEENGAGPAFDASLGARFYDYFYLGLELGYACIFEKMELAYTDASGNGTMIENIWMYTHLLSFSANMKGYLPVSEKFFPFVNLSMGLGIFPLGGIIHDKQHRQDYDIYVGNSMTWFNMQIGAGFDFKRFSMGIGYHFLTKNGVNCNLGYLKVGIRL